METPIGDEPMLDIAKSLTRYDASQPHKDTPHHTNSSIIPLAQSGTGTPNGSQIVTRNPTSGSRDKSLELAAKGENDHLVEQVRCALAITHPSKRTQTVIRNPTPGIRDNSLDLPLKRPRTKSEERTPKQVHSALGTDYPSNGTPASMPSSSPLVDHKSPKRHQLQIAMLPTGLCYDVRMRFHCELQLHQRADDHHPEDPRRIFEIYQALCHAGLVDDPMSTRPLVPQPLARVMARNATAGEICLVHSAKHYAFMDGLRDASETKLLEWEKDYDSIYLNQLTNMSALLSAGGAIEVCRAVTNRQIKNGIAVIRPPGHHAEPEQPMGFCFFDNVAIAARTCQADYGDKCRKILIIDWDVHHGNGIQRAFEWDPNVLYISIHVFRDEGGLFYPGSEYGNHKHCGLGKGVGFNINIPWSSKGMGDADYLYAFQQIVMPVAFEFNPDLVIIAAGFDAAQGDMLGGCFVSPAGYAHMTHMLMSLAEGRLAVCLEGGYNLTAIANSALAVTRVLMGEPPDRLEETRPTDAGLQTVQTVAMYQSRYWRCLEPKDLTKSETPLITLPPTIYDVEMMAEITDSIGGERLHDAIRYYQAAQMFDKHKMFPLHPFKDDLSKSFENQILATHNYAHKVPLILFFHEPPDIIGTPDPNTHELDTHNSWLADGLKYYIDWAAQRGYAVIDVNIPKHLTGIDEDDGFFVADKQQLREAANKLMVYLWENYLDINESTEIFLVGVGDPYAAFLHLLDNRATSLQRISGVISFINRGSMYVASDQNTYWLSKWYRQNSMVFVSEDNPIYSISGPKKLSKRYGNLVKSYGRGLNGMLMAHKEEVQEFIERRIKSTNLGLSEFRDEGMA